MHVVQGAPPRAAARRGADDRLVTGRVRTGLDECAWLYGLNGVSSAR
jgi:hypothetical protein